MGNKKTYCAKSCEHATDTWNDLYPSYIGPRWERYCCLFGQDLADGSPGIVYERSNSCVKVFGG